MKFKAAAAVLAALLCLTFLSDCHRQPDGQPAYSEAETVVLHIEEYGRLPENYLTKREARNRGWRPGSDLWKVAKGYSIGGDRFYNRERLLP